MKRNLLYIAVTLCVCLIYVFFIQSNFTSVSRERGKAESTLQNRFHETVLVRYFTKSEEAMIKMMLDYYAREGLTLEQIKTNAEIGTQSEDAVTKMMTDYYVREGLPVKQIQTNAEIGSYTLYFYKNNYVTRCMFIHGKSYRDPFYIANYIGHIRIWADKEVPTKWTGQVTCANPAYFDGTGEVSYTLMDERVPDWFEQHTDEPWVSYFMNILEKQQQVR